MELVTSILAFAGLMALDGALITLQIYIAWWIFRKICQ
jgi:hypothetical protein